MGKKIIIGIAIGILIIGTLLVTAFPEDEAFLISETTNYGLIYNTVYLTIEENFGKDQIINISNIFDDNNLTNQIEYKTILLNQSYQKNINGYYNESQGKYKTTNESIFYANSTEFNITNYYDDDGNLMDCDFVLEDKTCFKQTFGTVGTREEYDFLPIPDLKEKIVINGQKIEMKQQGIPLPKNSEIQLVIKYSHPNVYENKPSSTQNKYDIVVTSDDGIDESILDPDWYNEDWLQRRTQIIQGGSGLLLNKPVFVNTSWIDGMQTDFDDVTFINGSCDDGVQNIVLDYNPETIVASVNMIAQIEFPTLGPGDNPYCVYYDNDGVGSQGDRAGTYDGDGNFVTVYLFKAGAGTTLNDSIGSGNGDGNGTLVNGPGWIGDVYGGGALDFNGGSSAVFIDESTKINFTSEDFSVSGWWYLDSGEMMIAGANFGWQFMLQGGTLTLRHPGASSDDSEESVTSGSWQHWAMAYDQTTDEVTFYQNGKADSGNPHSYPDPGVTNFTSVQYRLAEAPSGGTDFNGRMGYIEISDTVRTQDWFRRSANVSLINPTEVITWIYPDTTSYGTQANANSLTVAHTCTGTESNGILIVTVQVTDSSTAERVISTVTHNGESLTHLPGSNSDDGVEQRTEIWYRMNCTTGGTPNIVVTPTGKCTDLSLGAISLINVDDNESNLLGTNSSGDSTMPTLDITTVGTLSFVVDSLAIAEPEGSKIGSQYNEIHKTDVGGDTHASQYVDAGGAGVQVMNYSDTDQDQSWVMSAVAIRNITVEGGEPPVDTCTYTSGDWDVDCSDDCVITSPVDVGGNDISIIGEGLFTTDSDITNYQHLFIQGDGVSNKCIVRCLGGCFRT